MGPGDTAQCSIAGRSTNVKGGADVAVRLPQSWSMNSFRLVCATLAILVSGPVALGQSYTISTFAGGGLPVNISGTSANLYGTKAVAVDARGNVFFVDQDIVLRLY